MNYDSCSDFECPVNGEISNINIKRDPNQTHPDDTKDLYNEFFNNDSCEENIFDQSFDGKDKNTYVSHGKMIFVIKKL